MPAGILIVDDEAHIADVVEYAMKEHGYETRVAHDGDLGWQAFRERRPDLVILDLGLPGISGLDLFRKFRDASPELPVIMLTSRDEEVDRVLGLELGADDYVTKPFSPRELAARVKTVLRRTRPAARSAGTVLRHGPAVIDEEAHSFHYFGQEVELTRQELQLLACLVRHPASIFTREQLIRRIYGEAHPVTDRSIDASIKRLRRKLRDVRDDVDPVRTVHGIGYRLSPELESQA